MKELLRFTKRITYTCMLRTRHTYQREFGREWIYCEGGQNNAEDWIEGLQWKSSHP